MSHAGVYIIPTPLFPKLYFPPSTVKISFFFSSSPLYSSHIFLNQPITYIFATKMRQKENYTPLKSLISFEAKFGLHRIVIWPDIRSKYN